MNLSNFAHNYLSKDVKQAYMHEFSPSTIKDKGIGYFRTVGKSLYFFPHHLIPAHEVHTPVEFSHAIDNTKVTFERAF